MDKDKIQVDNSNNYITIFALIATVTLFFGILIGYYLGIYIAKEHFLPQLEGCVRLF